MFSKESLCFSELFNRINDVMKIEENVMSSFIALSCLQNDFQTVAERCAKIDGIARDLADVKVAIAKKSRNVISDTSKYIRG